ncbi:hypothetical protein P171DRAFT_517672 [Karstenula rhodostoma CBS 690.94]|uniref:Uncharacterized protein n=1 Tax=Karstenula rhodostoma CBS 690.94 TaxID=1392251 RepID=A0A9P4PVJ4_9PLEO|nr:hypothetical protein P171DRAFT_517672 [Karstenula rhodostoma CBS 690.94]
MLGHTEAAVIERVTTVQGCISSHGRRYSDTIQGRVQRLSGARVYSKTLTFPSDILRASSGALFDIYESRTVFGLPWTDFDHAVLWYVDDENDMEPFAYWARVQTFDDVSLPIREMFVAESDKDDLQLSSSREDASERDENSMRKVRVILTLPWNQGCIISPPPHEISANCSRERYIERLAERRTNYCSHW